MFLRQLVLGLCVVSALILTGCSSGNDPVNADKDMPKKAKEAPKNANEKDK
jgi:PBP1b-binding outer membrane lipoprotein LpoB